MNESELLDALVKRGVLDAAKAAECREVQQMMAQMGVSESLEVILVKKNYLKQDQIDEARRIPAAKPDLVPGYVEESVLGHGRFGSVHKARQVATGRGVAVKIIETKLLRTSADADRLIAEARQAMPVRHWGLAEVIDCGKEKNNTYFITEFIDGMTLRDTVLTTGPLGEKRSMQLASEIAQALGALHAQKRIHRNLTPGNVFLFKDGRAKLTDFGLTPSIEIPVELNDRGIAYGAPGWMAPEQIIGLEDLDGRADLYGLGAILYFALTGQPLFVGGGEKRMIEMQLQEIPPEPRSHVPTLSNSANAIVMKLLDRDRNRRYDTVADLLKDVEAILNPKAALANAKIEAARKGKWMTMAGAAAGLAAFAVVGFLFLRGSGSVETPRPPAEPSAKTPPPAREPETPKPPEETAKTPPPPVQTPARDIEAQALLTQADNEVQAQKWDEASKDYAELRRAYADVALVKDHAAELDQKLEMCRSKIAEAQPKPTAATPIAEEFKKIQKLMDAGQWADALAAIGALDERVKQDETSTQTLKTLREKCDLEARAVASWQKVQAAMKERRWNDVGDLARSFKAAFEKSATYSNVATELEAAKLTASRETIAAAAVQDVKDKFKSLKFNDAMSAYAELKSQHGETESYKAAEAELKALADGVDADKKTKGEAAAKKALDEANKLYEAKKWADADAAYGKLLEDFKDSEIVKAAEKEIADKRESMVKKVAGDKDAAARKDYAKAKALMDKKNYEEGVPALKAFQEKYGESDFAKTKKKEIEDYLDKGEAGLNRQKKSTIDDFESDASGWEAKGVRSDSTKIESVETAKVGSKAMSVHIPGHDENPRDGRWPRAAKRLSDELSEDVTTFTFWAKAEKPCKISFEVRQGEKDSESAFVVDKAVGADWTLVTVQISELKFVWSARRRNNPPKLDPSKITEVGFGMMNPGKAIDFIIDHVKVEERK